MKKLVLSVVLLSSFALAQSTTALLTGKWKVHNNVAGNESDSDCTFTQTVNDLTGSCTTDKDPVKISGKVDGKKVTWSYKSDYNGTPLTVTYTGTVDGDKITGEEAVDPFAVTGDFTAARTK